MVMIARNFAQILEVCDRVNLLQHGRITYDTRVDDTSISALTDLVSAEYRSRGIRTDDESG